MALASLLLSPRFVSFILCLSLLVPVIDLDLESRLNIHEIAIFTWYSTFRFCGNHICNQQDATYIALY